MKLRIVRMFCVKTKRNLIFLQASSIFHVQTYLLIPLNIVLQLTFFFSLDIVFLASLSWWEELWLSVYCRFLPPVIGLNGLVGRRKPSSSALILFLRYSFIRLWERLLDTSVRSSREMDFQPNMSAPGLGVPMNIALSTVGRPRVPIVAFPAWWWW